MSQPQLDKILHKNQLLGAFAPDSLNKTLVPIGCREIAAVPNSLPTGPLRAQLGECLRDQRS